MISHIRLLPRGAAAIALHSLAPGEEVVRARAGTDRNHAPFFVFQTSQGNLYISRGISGAAARALGRVRAFDVRGSCVVVARSSSVLGFFIDGTEPFSRVAFSRNFGCAVADVALTAGRSVCYFAHTAAHALHYCEREAVLGTLYHVVLFSVFADRVAYVTGSDCMCRVGIFNDAKIVANSSSDDVALHELPEAVHLLSGGVIVERDGRLSIGRANFAGCHPRQGDHILRVSVDRHAIIEGDSSSGAVVYSTNGYIACFEVVAHESQHALLIVENEATAEQAALLEGLSGMNAEAIADALNCDPPIESDFVLARVFDRFYRVFTGEDEEEERGEIDSSAFEVLSRLMGHGDRLMWLRILDEEFFDRVILQAEKKEMILESICFIFRALVFAFTKSPLNYRGMMPSDFAKKNAVFSKEYGFPIPPSKTHVYKLEEILFSEIEYINNKDDIKKILDSLLKLLLKSVVINFEKFISYANYSPEFRKGIKVKNLIKLLEILFSLERSDFTNTLIASLTFERYEEIVAQKEINGHILISIDKFWEKEYGNEPCKTILLNHFIKIQEKFQTLLENSEEIESKAIKNEIIGFIQKSIPKLDKINTRLFDEEVNQIISLQEAIRNSMQVYNAYKAAALQMKKK